MQIGMLDDLKMCIFHFMKTHKSLNEYNEILLSKPAYHDLTPTTKSYEEVSQWNGKERKEMSWYLLGVVTQPLLGGRPAQFPLFSGTIERTWALLEFYIYAQYKSHDDATLHYMEDAMYRFHTFKDVFLLGPAGKKAKAKASTLRMELVKKQKVDEETNTETSTLSKKCHQMNTWGDHLSHKIDVFNH
jgi:hypothetical protein